MRQRPRIGGTFWAGVFASLLAFAVPAAANFPPSPPVIDVPANGATNTNLQFPFHWIISDPDFDDLVCDWYLGTTVPPPLVQSNLAVPLVVSPPLQPGTLYFWRVVVRDEHGAETVGQIWTFSTKPTNTPPDEPSRPFPGNNAVAAMASGSLLWESDDPDGVDMEHDLYLGTTQPPPFVETIPVAGFRGSYPYNLQFATTYYWQIIARDPHGGTRVGPTWTFTTKPNSPPTIANPQPSHGSIASTSPLLTWSASDIDLQPLTFDVYFGTTNPPPLVAPAITTYSFDPGELQSGLTYFWKIVATDGLLTTTGPTWSFGARQPGDIVHDGVLTLADATCALEIFLLNPGCATTSQHVADADCSTIVTPGDARCIHREVIGAGCDICDQAVAPAPKKELTFPVISLASLFTEGNVLVLRLAVSDAFALNAFGCYATASPNTPFIEARRRGASNNFDVLVGRQALSDYAFVGGYAIQDQPTPASGSEFLELRFNVSGGIPNTIIIDGFVDDLAFSNSLAVQPGILVGTEPIPNRLALHQNYPNPFNPRTTIAYDLPVAPTSPHVRLRIADVAGRIVRTLVEEDQPGGSYRIEWDGNDDRGEAVSSGLYFFILDARGERHSRKLVLLK